MKDHVRTLLHHHLMDAAQADSSAAAVVDEGRVVTYGELDARSNQVAQALIAGGVRRGDRVGLLLDKSADAIAALYGVLKAGGAYVPLDQRSPRARLLYLARDCALSAIVTHADRLADAEAMVADGAPLRMVLTVDGIEPSDAVGGMTVAGRAVLDAQPRSAPAVATIGDDLAYVLYTSGSTGQPKGVMLSHRNGLAFVEWAVEAFALRPEDRLASHAPLHFDLSVFDLYAAAAAGARVALVPAAASVFPVELARFIANQGITVWYSVPSALRLLAGMGGLSDQAVPTLRVVLFAGEVFPTPQLRRLMELLPGRRFCNLYGPTETNVCTWHEVTSIPQDDRPVPIGVSIADVEVLVVDDRGGLAAPHEVGELYVRGPSVMHGYWGDPERTRRSLVPHPWRPELRDPAYVTGDRGYVDETGRIHLVGRRDDQVKTRGYRVELGEIEAVLSAHPSVAACAVVAVPDELVTNRLVACVVAAEPVAASLLARCCAEKLPRYMVPERFELRPSLPTTSTGKLDRRALVAEVAAPSPQPLPIP